MKDQTNTPINPLNVDTAKKINILNDVLALVATLNARFVVIDDPNENKDSNESESKSFLQKLEENALEWRKELRCPHLTPDALWRLNGEEDPHNDAYDCERNALTLGHLTDDELANAVFLHHNDHPTPMEILAGVATSGIVYLTAAKDRIRWLSRQLAKANQRLSNQ